MKRLFPILLLFSIYSHGQSEQAQAIFDNKIWREVIISDFQKSFFDLGDKYLGSSVETDMQIIYRDKWKRIVKVFPKSLNYVKKKSVDDEINVKNNFSDYENRVVVKRNKATYYDSMGRVETTAKRRGKKKVFFHNGGGNLIGYKIYKSNGMTFYKDNRGRILGKSYINRGGRMIFKPKNRKTKTPRILFEDPFLFDN